MPRLTFTESTDTSLLLLHERPRNSTNVPPRTTSPSTGSWNSISTSSWEKTAQSVWTADCVQWFRYCAYTTWKPGSAGTTTVAVSA